MFPRILPATGVNDEIKLWRETNDGMYWLQKSCEPKKGQFGVVGVQVYRKTLNITVLVRDIHWYYHIAESEIPVRQSDTDVVTEFVKSLLILRNVLNVNISLLFSTRRSEKTKCVEICHLFNMYYKINYS